MHITKFIQFLGVLLVLEYNAGNVEVKIKTGKDTTIEVDEYVCYLTADLYFVFYSKK